MCIGFEYTKPTINLKYSFITEWTWFLIAPAYSRVRYRSSTYRPFIRPSIRLFVHSFIHSLVLHHVDVLFSAAVIAGSMKSCIVIVLDTLFKHAPWPSALDLHFTLHWLCQNFVSSLENLSRVYFFGEETRSFSLGAGYQKTESRVSESVKHSITVV